jgi:hypothetical protein
LSSSHLGLIAVLLDQQIGGGPDISFDHTATSQFFTPLYGTDQVTDVD